MTTTLIISGCIAFFLAGYLCALTRNKARMTKLASSNIDLMDIHESYGNQIKKEQDSKNNWQEGFVKLWTENGKLAKENEALKFQIQQYNAGMDQMKFTDQG